MMSPDHHSQSSTDGQSGFYYGWVIVAICTVSLILSAGVMYSYGVFFKRLAASFEWTRAATSGVYSIFMFVHGAFAMPMGWLVDRAGPRKTLMLCGFIMGLGLILTSQITALWQIYITFGVLVGIGTSGIFPVGMGTTARWFTARRGLALGIVSAGLGLGTLLLIPAAERLITAYGWSVAYLVLGVATLLVIMPSSLFLWRDPEAKFRGRKQTGEVLPANSSRGEAVASQIDSEPHITVGDAVRRKPLWMLVAIFFFFCFSLQLVMVHLVNYATDLGIDSLVAATFLSVLGFTSVLGRLVMGTASDRIGSHNAMVICCAVMIASLVLLMFTREIWMFYLFAAIFGFAYGGEVPQMPSLIGNFFGWHVVATLLGIVLFGADTGGAIGSWVGGSIFDMTQSYQVAFGIGAVSSLLSMMLILMLKRVK